MDWIVLLPVLAFVALAAGLAVVFRGTGRIVARTREVEGFRSSVRDLCARVDQSLEGAATRIDQVRHHELTPETLGATLTVAADAIDLYVEEARAMKGPPAMIAIRDELIAAMERAGRALATVEHGAAIMEAARGGYREFEADTSIKRGYLNLLHARQAIADQGAAARDLTLPDRPIRARTPTP
jgi:hypothetical protein